MHQGARLRNLEDDLGRKLRLGGRDDAHVHDDGHPALHVARADGLVAECRRPHGHLGARRRALRAPDGEGHRFHGSTLPGGLPQDHDAAAAAASRREARRARPARGGDPEMPREGPKPSLVERRRAARGACTCSHRSAAKRLNPSDAPIRRERLSRRDGDGGQRPPRLAWHAASSARELRRSRAHDGGDLAARQEGPRARRDRGGGDARGDRVDRLGLAFTHHRRL